MTKLTHIIGIWGNIAPPNPRLPAYIIPSLIRDEVTNILLVTSLDAVTKSLSWENAKKAFRHTTSKLSILKTFRNEFFSESAQVAFEEQKWTDYYSDSCWLGLWDQVENYASCEQKVKIEQYLKHFWKIHDEDLAKIYAVRHAFWFFDISRSQKDGLLESVWWPQEQVFNIFRIIISKIPNEVFVSIFWESFIKNSISKTVIPSKSRVIPYWEATRKVGGKRKSIEYQIWQDQWSILTHYQWSHQLKSWLYSDIDRIYRHVDPSLYEEFWKDITNSIVHFNS